MSLGLRKFRQVLALQRVFAGSPCTTHNSQLS